MFGNSNNLPGNGIIPPNQTPVHAQPQGTNSTILNGSTEYFDASCKIILGTARIIIEEPDGQKIPARALIDNCSQPSFVFQRIFKALKLPSRSTNAIISAVGGVKAMVEKEFAEFIIRPHFYLKFTCKVQALVVSRVCNYVSPQSQVDKNFLYLSHLNLDDPTFLDNTEIEVSLW